MNAPKVLTAGGAASLSTSTSLPYKHKQTSSPSASASASASASGGSSDDQQSPDRAAGSAPSSPIKTEIKLTDTDTGMGMSMRSLISQGLSSSQEGSSNLSYEDEEEDDSETEMHGLLNVDDKEAQRQLDDLYTAKDGHGHGTDQSFDNDDALTSKGKLIWLGICFFGIMLSFVGYGLLLEYATSGGRKLHELSFLFVTSLLYTCTAAAGRHVRDETPSTIPPARFAILGITSMGSTFCSVRSLR